MAIKQLGKYEIIERLGRGGMAEVYKGYQVSLDRYVAIKLLHPFLADDPEFKDRFEREARNVARLRHPNIVQVYDFEYDDPNESFYMVMELIDGQTLKDRVYDILDRGEQLPLEEVLHIIRGAGAALAYAHARGMIHRDVKPANLMIDSDGRIVLTDFGIAKIVTGIQFTASGGMVGTPAYMAPEQGLGEQGDERSDIYSLGVILYQLCTGMLPYDAETPLAVILKHLNEPVPLPRKLNPGLSEAFEAVIVKALAKEPEERFQTADEMLKALDQAEGGIPPPPSNIHATGKLPELPPPPLSPVASDSVTTPAPPSSRTRLAGIGAIIIIGLIVTFGALALRGGNGLLGFLNPSSTPTQTLMPTFTAIASAIPSLTPRPTDTPTVTATLTYTPTLSDTPTPTMTLTPSQTSTLTPTTSDTPSLTPTVTATYTATATNTPTATFTPSLTPTPTTNLTATLQAATDMVNNQTATSVYATFAAIAGTQAAQRSPTPNYTATALLCKSQYLVVQPKPPAANDPIRADTDFQRTIILRNTGNCDWLPGMYLSYSSGESFSAPIKIIMTNTQPVAPNDVANFTFNGHTPRKGGLYSGNWEVRLYPDNKLLDPLLTIQFYGYE